MESAVTTAVAADAGPAEPIMISTDTAAAEAARDAIAKSPTALMTHCIARSCAFGASSPQQAGARGVVSVPR